ncbi:MAG: hypothetical protein GX575_10325 [Candidatus Anammoximicrobium sp.]|mgnify:CR=1 FL=1|nr:hypothetical protein [Candidatus Anammoximicrobium sp.]
MARCPRLSSNRCFLLVAGVGGGFLLLLWLHDASATPAEQPAASADAAPAADKPHCQPASEPADNSYCYVCHAPYEQEELSKTHQRAGVGCETCHGMSVQHSGDEDGLTPPEIMFPKEKIAASCLAKCHKKEDLVASGDHDEVFAAAKKTDKTCTDCHAEKHRLKVRTRIWDKATGKLLSDDGVRMMYKDSPATTGVSTQAKPKP